MLTIYKIRVSDPRTGMDQQTDQRLDGHILLLSRGSQLKMQKEDVKMKRQRRTEGRLLKVNPKTKDDIYYEPKPKPKITKYRCPKIQLLLEKNSSYI